MVMWKNNEKPKKINASTVVFQASYKCTGNCPNPPSDEDPSSGDDNSQQGGGDGTRKAGRPRKTKRKCPVRLVVSRFYDLCAFDTVHSSVTRFRSVLVTSTCASSIVSSLMGLSS